MIDWDGPNRQECPDCSRGPKDRTCGVGVDPRDGKRKAHCHRCHYVETRRDDSNFARRGVAPPPRSAPTQFAHLSQYGRELFAACVPLRGTIGEQYLLRRYCVMPPADGDLRFHPGLKHPASDHIGPALLARVTDAMTGEPLTLHRTWIKADGSKADVNPPRMLLGGHRKAGGVVRLWPDEAVTLGLGIAEGIETALSLAHAFTPVWACIDAGNMATLPVLDIESLMIAADHDDAGLAAAEACAARWAELGREVAIAMPPTRKTDLNDVAVIA